MTPPINVLITGATGFIGQSLLKNLISKKNLRITTLSRPQKAGAPEKKERTALKEEKSDTGNIQLEGVDTVIHLAGRAHILKETSENPLDLYRADNVSNTLKLAEQALRAGAKRFIFISSIGVNGSSTNETPFSELSEAAPQQDYAISKWEAELSLKALVEGSTMELTIIRPPLVYAGHAPGNFHRLIKIIDTGLPLPFGSVKNSRSMIALENLVDFISLCIEHPAAGNETFLISDGMDFSTPQIIKQISKGLNREAKLLPVPPGLIFFGANLLGMQTAFQQLCGSLLIDSSKARTLLGWNPPIAADQALVKAGQDFRRLKGKKQ
ncbi:NAD-dependent epimerase/dehydratase family protein [Pseudomonas sp. 210_17 TE3656]